MQTPTGLPLQAVDPPHLHTPSPVSRAAAATAPGPIARTAWLQDEEEGPADVGNPRSSEDGRSGNTPSAQLRITGVNQGDFRWDLKSRRPEVWLLSREPVEVTLEGHGQGSDLAVELRAAGSESVKAKVSGGGEDPLNATLSHFKVSGKQDIVVLSGSQILDRVTIYAPRDLDELPPPTVTRYADNVFGSPVPLASEVAAYGAFIKLAGDQLAARSGLRAFAFSEPGAGTGAGPSMYLRDVPVDSLALARGDWTADLRLPPLSTGTQIRVVLIADDGRTGGHSFAATVLHNGASISHVPVSYEASQHDLRATITQPAENARDQALAFSSMRATLEGTMEGSGNLESHSRVVLFLDGAQEPLEGVAVAPAGNGWKATFELPRPGTYSVQAAVVVGDDFGPLSEPVRIRVVASDKLADQVPAMTAPGIRGPTGDFVTYPEFLPPREFTEGFNPSDHVETRVSRLYYYRDAHRVAQIVNRKSESHNRAAVGMLQQLADKSRQTADQATIKRRSLERQAVAAAEEARGLEAELAQAQAGAQQAAREAAAAADQRQRLLNDDDETNDERAAALLQVVGQLESVATQLRGQERVLYDRLQDLRSKEAAAREAWLGAQADEDRMREEQFRLEVAAAHEDPDTYAEGDPDSNDPVEQVSVSVVGEGLIHLRGPIKGINIIRLMINQLDAPVGQVRVGVHTVQVNGERGDRMEEVAYRIQTFIDQSRFLTSQSAELLRASVVKVAAMKATEAGDYPGLSQHERDLRYLNAFFGEDFIRELADMQSEFLDTGNKLLSLHSMDSTSLPAALFLMALAKNSTRMMILNEYETALQTQLPLAEQQYIEAGMSCSCKHKLFGHCKHHNQYMMLAPNAQFQSLRGFFSAEIVGDDTMTPIQREFVRLAQIFKSRLIVEQELRQRIRERAVIEERVGDRQSELVKAARIEAKAKGKLDDAREVLARQRENTLTALTPLLAAIQEVRRREQASQAARAEFHQLLSQPQAIGNTLEAQIHGNRYSLKVKAVEEANGIGYVVLDGDPVQFRTAIAARLEELYQLYDYLSQNFKFRKQSSLANLKTAGDQLRQWKSLQQRIGDDALNVIAWQREELESVHVALSNLASEVTDGIERLQQMALSVIEDLQNEDADIMKAYRSWLTIEREIAAHTSGELAELAREKAAKVNAAFHELLASHSRATVALEEAKASRRPLDHKKFLDMLIDEMEDKYIELLEGTRAHTANIDAYIKRVTTALDDDFNRQFYQPAFRQVREASRYWDVTLGQIETTTILANNREFAKVVPQATMEFDLPKRDILITEAMQGAKAMVDEYGALLQDPTFLALTKLKSGQPTSSLASGAGGRHSTVRNVLPTLSTDTAEDVLAQQGPGTAEFGSALEALIPDPAIYKFETGTGFEIRPVIQPDGQAVVFDFNYMYTTNVREPVRADEKHLGRVKRHFVDTDVQLGNFEMREVSRYQVALKAARTARGVPLLEDIPGAGVLFRPLPSDESSLQENIILAQATVFPTLFDLMGLRWAPAVADLDPLRLVNDEFIVRGRRREVMNRVFDTSSNSVDEFLRIPEGQRRADLYRSQETVPHEHPNGYIGPGLDLKDSHLQEGFDPEQRPESRFVPSESVNGASVPEFDAAPPVLLNPAEAELEMRDGVPTEPDPRGSLEEVPGRPSEGVQQMSYVVPDARPVPERSRGRTSLRVTDRTLREDAVGLGRPRSASSFHRSSRRISDDRAERR